MSVPKTSFSFLSLQLLFNNAFFTLGGFGSCPPCCLPLGSHEVLCDDKIAVKTHSSFPARNTGVHATCFSEVFVRWGRELKVAVLISWWEIKTKKLGGWAVWHMEWGKGTGRIQSIVKEARSWNCRPMAGSFYGGGWTISATGQENIFMYRTLNALSHKQRGQPGVGRSGCVVLISLIFNFHAVLWPLQSRSCI